jgi:hypothetical protein
MDSVFAVGSFWVIVIGGGLAAFSIIIVIIRWALGINRSLQQRDDIIASLQRIEKTLAENQTKNPAPPA